MKAVWISCCALALFVASCGSGGNDTANNMPGKAVFDKQSCALCHGDAGKGTTKAPALKNLEDQWTKDQLLDYLKQPAQYAESDPRLKEQESKYPTMMPNYGHLGDADLSDLADFLMAL